MDNFLGAYESALLFLARVTVHTLELVGISIVIFGAVKVLVRHITYAKSKGAEPHNAVIALGRSLALALEFKMGAEIVNTVIVRELKELFILGIVIALRAILAILIHWEITTEEKEERAHATVKNLGKEYEKNNETED